MTLPSYERPPVSEVVIAAAYAEPPGLTTAHLGAFWQAELRSELPRIEEQPGYIPPIESLGPPSPAPLSLQILGKPPGTRLWAQTEDGTRLLQLQRGWLAFNWRDAPGSTAPYPRWARVEESFTRYYLQLSAFFEREGFGAIEPSQGEVTYINNIKAGGAWADHGELHKVIALLDEPAGFLGNAETTQLVTAFRIRDGEDIERGRLHITAQPAFEFGSNSPVLILSLVARGAPGDQDLGGLLSFLRLGHERVVEGFTAATTEQMHQEWGRLV